MKLKASIDIGSNSILLLALDEEGNPVLNEARVTGLGRGLDRSGKFIDEAIEDSKNVFSDYQRLCKSKNIDPSKVIVTATEASRVASNSREFFQDVKKQFGFNVQIITGEAEAFYSTLGVLADKNINEEFITIMDIGGASTELIRVNTKKQEILTSFSMPVGVVRLNNWLEEERQEKEMIRVLNEYSEQLDKVESKKIYCVAGTMTSVGNMHLGNKDFVESEVHGLVVSSQNILDLLVRYEKTHSEDILKEFPFLGKRAATIQSGLLLANTVLARVKADEAYISTYGLRYGTILSGGIKDGFIFKD